MKDSTISSLELDVKIRKVVLRFSAKEKRENHPQKASLSSVLASDKPPIGLSFLSEKFKSLLSYLVLYHYYPLDPTVLCYFHLDLIDHLEKTEAYWLSVLMDKDLFLKYLEVQETMTEQVLFAGIVNETNLRQMLDLIVYLFERKLKRPKEIVRRKGYRDKGSLGDLSTSFIRKECKSDYYLTLLQFEIEEQRIIRQTESQLLREFLLEGRGLTDELKVKFRLQKGEIKNEESGKHQKSAVKDYCERRANEDVIKEEREHRKRAEAAWIEAFEAKTHFGTSDNQRRGEQSRIGNS
jgi:hypothetical protein